MIRKYAKAVVAAVVAGSGALSTALVDDSVSTGEWVFVVLAVLGGLGITAWVPNKDQGQGQGQGEPPADRTGWQRY